VAMRNIPDLFEVKETVLCL